MTTRTPLRDTLAYALCNLILNTVATKEYRDGVEQAIRRGLSSPSWPPLQVPTDEERRMAARIRVRADKARGLKTPRWIRDLADPPTRRTPDIWDMPEDY